MLLLCLVFCCDLIAIVQTCNQIYPTKQPLAQPIIFCAGQDRENFEGILKKTKAEQHKFHDVYKTAKQIKENFLQNVHSKPAEKINKELEHFKLPTLPGIKDGVLELYKELGV
ncbi:MAG: hypothetical protein V5804_00390 [Mucilaginibacter sp.]|uniref:hypothetical protein n=1 Tax=Mucilaginibacter sp. TaxID=1882438 RepID=UPI0034E3E3EE